MRYKKDRQYYKFSLYGFFKNLRFFDPFLLLFFVDKGLSYSEVGVLYAFREVIINLFEIASGVIADIMGRKKAMVSAFVAYLISFLVFYSLPYFWGFVIAFFFYGIGDSFRTGTHKAMMYAYLLKNNWQAEKTHYYGQTRSWSQKGSAISALISAILVFYTGDYGLMFLLTSIPYLIDLLLLASYPNYLNGSQQSYRGELGQQFKMHFAGLFNELKKRSSIRVVGLTSSFTGYYKASKDYIQIIIMSLASGLVLIDSYTAEQNAAVYIGIAYFVLFWLTSLASKNAYRIEAILGAPSKSLVRLQSIAYVLGFIAGILFVKDFYLAALFCFSFIFIIQNFRRPIAVKYVADKFDEKMMASIMSVESQGETLFASIFALILGVLIDVAGMGWGIAFLSVLLMATSVILRGLKRKRIDK